MADDPNRKKSLREQVEEYKRAQKEAEAKAANEAKASEVDDEEEEEEDEDQDEERASDLEPQNASTAAKGPDVGRIVSTVFLWVGLVLILVSVTLFWSTRKEVAAEVSVEGVVMKNIVRTHTTRATNSSRETTSDLYHAVVEFPLADGARKTVEMAEGNWPKAYDEGEKVTVRYDPVKPLKARLGGGTAMDFFASLLTGFLGAVFTALAIGIRRALTHGVLT